MEMIHDHKIKQEEIDMETRYFDGEDRMKSEAFVKPNLVLKEKSNGRVKIDNDILRDEIVDCYKIKKEELNYEDHDTQDELYLKKPLCVYVKEETNGVDERDNGIKVYEVAVGDKIKEEEMIIKDEHHNR